MHQPTKTLPGKIKIYQRAGFVLVSGLLLLNSCSAILGLKKIRPYSPDELAKRDKTYGIARATNHGAGYRDSLRAAIPDKGLRKDMWQPLQYWTFSRQELIFNNLNCNMPGFPNLKWTVEKDYDTRNVASKIEEPDFGQTFATLHGIDLAGADTTMVICYTYFMGRQNKRFLRSTRKFLRKHPGIAARYVNMDNTFTE